MSYLARSTGILLGMYLGLAAPAAFAQEVLLGEVARPTTVSAFDGQVLWSEYDERTKRYRLAHWVDGRRVLLPIASRRVPFDATLGTDAAGDVVVSYSRCRNEPRYFADNLDKILAPWTGSGCDIYHLPLDVGKEVASPYARTTKWSEVQPAMWQGRLIFVRLRDTPGRAGVRPRLVWRRKGTITPLPSSPRGELHTDPWDGSYVRAPLSVGPGPASVHFRRGRLTYAWGYFPRPGTCPESNRTGPKSELLVRSGPPASSGGQLSKSCESDAGGLLATAGINEGALVVFRDPSGVSQLRHVSSRGVLTDMPLSGAPISIDADREFFYAVVRHGDGYAVMRSDLPDGLHGL